MQKQENQNDPIAAGTYVAIEHMRRINDGDKQLAAAIDAAAKEMEAAQVKEVVVTPRPAHTQEDAFAPPLDVPAAAPR